MTIKGDMPASRTRALIGANLAADRGGRRVFEGVSFRAEAGTALIVTGPNGAGKSSLLRVIAGLVREAEGTLTLDGGDPDLSVPQQAHYFGHLDALKPSLTVAENLAFWRAYNRPTGLDVEDALDAVQLAALHDLPAAYLSAGQRRRLAFARLLVSHRPLWLLDEPTSALDADSERRLIGLVNDHLATGGLVVAATHLALPLARSATIRLEAAREMA
jgi:heme exporter protein A